jgi:alpha-tubulin suppressor-like RCC1 family protein
VSEIAVTVTNPGAYSVTVDGATPTTATVSSGGAVSVSVPGVDVQWADLEGVPATFPPAAHQHPISDVTGLQTALDGKAASGHGHAYPVTSVNGFTGDVVIEAGAGGATLSSDLPEPLGIHTAGISSQAARSDHVHQMPTAADVGALDQNSIIDGGDYTGVIVVPETPAITITAQPTNQTAAGGAATFYVAAIHSTGAAISYQWQKSDDGTTWQNVSAATSATLSLSGLTNAADNGDKFRCNLSATGTAGLTTGEATLTVPVGVASSGPMFSWGTGSYGVIGNGSLAVRSQPTAIGTPESWSAVSTWNYHSLAIRSDGMLFAWGLNNYGQVGNGTNTNATTPVPITLYKWLAVSAGLHHSLAIRDDGALFAWGRNTGGLLGNATGSTVFTPYMLSNSQFTAVSAGKNGLFSFAIRSDGKLFAWGQNDDGQLGLGSSTSQIGLTEVPVGNCQAVSAGGTYAIAITNENTMLAWGRSAYGAMGLDSTISTVTPTQVGSSSNWASVSAAYDHSCAIDANGNLYAFGDNANGELGDGTYAPRFIPGNPVAAGVVSASAGERFTLAIRTTGKLIGTGENGLYQLADGTTQPRNTFLQIGQANWLSVSAGTSGALGINQ